MLTELEKKVIYLTIHSYIAIYYKDIHVLLPTLTIQSGLIEVGNTVKNTA